MNQREADLIEQMTQIGLRLAELTAENKILKSVNDRILQALPIHGVMQAEGSDVSEGAAVASEGEEKCVSDGHDETHVTIKDGDFEWCMACSRQVKRV